jgi:transposase-like protein
MIALEDQLMGQKARRYTPEFRRQMVELQRSGRSGLGLGYGVDNQEPLHG